MLFWTMVTLGCLFLAAYFYSRSVLYFWRRADLWVLRTCSIILLIAAFASAYMAG